MAKYRICLIEGDGIGHEVIPAARRVLEASGLDAEFVSAEAGYEYFLEHGTSVPQATYEAIESTDATLFGAATSPSGEKPAGFFGAIRHLRRKYDLYANVRPTRTRPVPGAYENVDLVIVRENTQGLYVEQERRYGDTAIADTVITKDASARIGRFAADLAMKRRKKLTVVHKSNALPVTQGLFMNTVLDEAQAFVDSGTLGGGMLPKLQNCIDAIRSGVSRVHILDGRIPHCLLLEIFTDKGIGTAIFNSAEEERYYHG